MNCGARLTHMCPECDTRLPVEARFCFACGARVGAAPPALVQQPLTPGGVAERLQRLVPKAFAERLRASGAELAGERRVVTILFCDVTGSTAMAEQLDPEDVMEIMDGAFDVMIEPIVRYEGTVARLMGDAVLAFFGAPIAHEDDPERACRAALEITTEAQRYAEELERQRGVGGFDVRVGINTGLVVVGEVGSDLRVEYTAMGDAINLAARMEGAAEPGTILITEDTDKLVALLFETEALGPIDVKGKAEPISTYRVLGAKEVPGKVRGIAGLDSPLVGRKTEFGAIQEAMDRLESGIGGIVTIIGEAGIGKSRLVAELRKRSQHNRTASPEWLEGRCLSYGTSIAYLLWLDVLRDLLGVTPEASPTQVRDALHHTVEAICSESSDQVTPYLGRLMSLPLTLEEEALLKNLTPEVLRANTLQALETILARSADERPLIVVCEDLHWADPSSLEVLEHVLCITDRAPLLIVCLFRPKKEHGSWRLRQAVARDYPHRHTDLWLPPLSDDQSETLMSNLLRADALPRQLADRILGHAEGNPFYVEEIIRSLIDGGAIVEEESSGRWEATQHVADIPIPETLYGVLMARIDRLREDTKRVLQMASVIGRVFLYRVLTEIAEEERSLDDRLLTLQREEMVRERARLPELEYIFKHELTREAAYNGLLKRERRAFHRQVAEALERLFPERIEKQLELLAHHWERARDPEKATHYLQRAGERSVRLSADQEAVEHFSKALAMLQCLPDTAERAERELNLRVNLIPPLIAVSAYGSPQVGQIIDRALELGKQVGDPPELFIPILALGAFHGAQANYHKAEAYWEELMALAERVGDPLLIALSHWLGWVSLLRGEFDRALNHLGQVTDFYDPQKHGSLLLFYGVDPGAICLSWIAWTLCQLGYPDQALERARQALSLAQELQHPHTSAFTQTIAGMEVHHCRREIEALEGWAEATISLSAEYGIPYFHSRGISHQGWVLVEKGKVQKGLAQMRHGLQAMKATGNRMYVPMELARIGEAHGRLGERQEGLAALSEALELAHETGERYFEAEIHRLRSEMVLAAGDEAGAEASFQRAIEVARQQDAKWWELRAAVSLCRLWQEQGKREEARRTLARIYGWFTEGFDAPDLMEAKELLSELS